MKAKLLVFWVMIGAVLGLSACKQASEWTQFEMEYTQPFEVSSLIGINLPFNLITPNITTNSEVTFAGHDTHSNLVEEIQLTGLDMTLTSPSNGDFDFLKSIEVYISTDSLPETRIAWANDIPDNSGQFLELETTSTELKQFLIQEEFTLRLSTVTDQLLASDHEFDVHSVFFVDAQILGQ